MHMEVSVWKKDRPPGLAGTKLLSPGIGVSHYVSALSPYLQTLKESLWHNVGGSVFAAVAICYCGVFLYLSGMLLYRPNMTFSVPMTFPLVRIDLNPPGNYQPYLLFLPTDDFILLLNLTGAVVALAFSSLVGVNVALWFRHWKSLKPSTKTSGGFMALLLPSLVPNLGCCSGVPLLLALLPGTAFGVGATLGRQFGLVMAGAILLMLVGTWMVLRAIQKDRRECKPTTTVHQC